MEALHKIAGVDLNGDRDKDRASRASLPLNRQASHKSFSSSRGNRLDADYPPVPAIDPAQLDDGGPKQAPPQRTSHDTATSSGTDTASTDDFVWGASHPCFPHPNPHCLPASAEHATTRVIRVRRDWLQSGDLYPQYANVYPEILDPLVTDDDFRFLVSNINARLKAAFDPFSTRAWVDTWMGVMTGFLWDDFGMTGAKRAEKGLEQFLEHWNRGKEKEGREVRVVQPRRTGFMSLDFVVPDPGIDAMGGGNDDEDEREGEGGIGPAD
ncbi:hypothetical protein LTR65_001723 [Meristemomyces frigidus]